MDDWLLADEPHAVMHHPKRSPARHVLMRVLRGEMATTHEALDTVEQTSALAYLRARLVALGVLPQRDERMAVLAQAVGQLGSETQGPDGKLLRQYGRWSVLRRAQLSTRDGILGEGASRYATDCVQTAVGLVEWLHGQDRLNVRTRPAGCLVLLFGQPLTRIVRLTTRSVSVTEGRVWLHLGRAPLPMASWWGGRRLRYHFA